MKKNTSLIKKAGAITALMGGAVACCIGSTMIGTVFSGMLISILASKVEQLKIKDIQKLFLGGTPLELNNDLEKLIQEAMVWSTKNICYSYQSYCINDSQKKSLKKNQKQIIDQINSINENQWQVSNGLINEIDNISDDTNIMTGLIAVQSDWSEINIDRPFPIYYETHFIENFKLCFNELLKDPKNESALKAYKRNISTQIQKQLLIQDGKLDSLLKDNKTIKKQLAKIASSPIELFEQQYIIPEINIVLDDYLKPLHDDVQLLVGINGKVLVNIEKIKEENEHLSQQIKKLVNAVYEAIGYKILYHPIVLILVALFLGYSGHKYWLSSQPFVFTVNVTNGSLNKSLSFKEPQIKIISGETEDSKQTQDKRAVFSGLPSHLRKDSIRVQIESYGFKKIDTVVSGVKNLDLTMYRDNTYRWLSGVVKDESTRELIANAKVRVMDLSTFTNIDGRFKLDIPEVVQDVRQWIVITKKGYEPYENNESIILNEESIIQLEKSKE